jgi:hypothetical protein
LNRDDIALDDISCGYTVDHPHFDEIITPLFERALKRLIRDVIEGSKERAGTIASTAISIARTRYTIDAENADDWIKFPVKAITVFEKSDQRLMDRTVEWLHNRLILMASPSLFEAESN